MRHKIVAGNWKMHKNAEETEDLLNELIEQLPDDVEVEIIVAPTFVNCLINCIFQFPGFAVSFCVIPVDLI